MPVENGHITGPVGNYTVMITLGESSMDSQHLCCSPKINPDSLIRPLYWNRNIPGAKPADFATTNLPALVPQSLPEARKARLDYGVNVAAYPDEFPCVADFGYTGTLWCKYEQRKWGYFVPYVEFLANVGALRDVMWERFGPEYGIFDSNGQLTDCFAEMPQFDGYQHNATPKCPIRSATLEYGKKFAVYFQTDVGNYTDAQILGTEGKAHPGGTVSIPAVFGTGTFYYGFSVFRRQHDNEPFVPLWHMVAGKVVAQNPGGGNTVTQPAGQKTDRLLTRYTYIVIPWVTNNPDISDLSSPPAGQRFYGCYFSSYHGKDKYYLEKEIIPKTVQFGRLMLTGQSVWQTAEEVVGGATYWVVKFWIHNPYLNYPLKATDFFVEYTYKETENSQLKKGGAGTGTSYDGSYGISGYSPASATVTGDNTVSLSGSGGNTATMERLITIKFQKPSPCFSNLPSIERLILKSLDKNAEGCSETNPLAMTVILNKNDVPHIIPGTDWGMENQFQ